MSILKSVLYHFTGQILIPECVENMSVKIVHLSDTPSQVYKSIIRFVSKVQPDILVHTGDIADDIKLEIMPSLIESYRYSANYLLGQLTQHVKQKIIIVPGNHDNIEVLDIRKNMFVYREGTIIDLHGISVGLAHKLDMLPSGCYYYLYGHDRSAGYDGRYLNGIEYINLIDPANREVLKLRYPTGTDDYRLKRTKIGI